MQGNRKENIMLNEDIVDTMVRMATEAARNSYLLYRKFQVGACALANDGTLYSGCIIQNSAPQLSISAEQAAMIKALVDGKRSFDAVAVVADTVNPYIPSASSCQFMSEFDVSTVVMANMHGAVEIVSMKELMPFGDKRKENHRYKEE